MQVTPETTPNPATMKFNISQFIVAEPQDFPTALEAERSPLASKIFGFPWTSAVFLGPDFVSVTKQDWVDWEVLAEPLAGLIREHIESGAPVLVEILAEASEDELPEDSDVIKQIKRILKNEIRPVVAMDGGDVAFAGYDNGILSLQMKGSCAGCPSKSATLKDGIEVRFREAIPEIREVVAV
jgi:NFU1 iron-sulfur cluster scaffold homolog, mitochondrial